MVVPSVPRQAPRTPIFNVPGVIAAVAALLIAVHVARVALPQGTDLAALRELAFVPARLWNVLDPRRLSETLSGLSGDPQAADRAALARYFVIGAGLKPWTVLTYAFLHGNVSHLAMNLLWLVAFGAPVARRFGAARFLAFLAVASIAGAAAHSIVHPFDVEPVIGASAAVSGVIAAAIRFVFQPGERLGPPRAEGDAALGRTAPPLPLAALLRNRPVVSFLCVWFVVNFVFGILSVPLGITEQTVAWEAHIGGFLAGLLLFSLFDPKPVAVAPL